MGGSLWGPDRSRDAFGGSLTAERVVVFGPSGQKVARCSEVENRQY